MFSNFNELSKRKQCEMMHEERENLPTNSFFLALSERDNEWEVQNLKGMVPHIGGIYLSRASERKLKELWAERRKVAMGFMEGTAEAGFPQSKRFYSNLAKMYTHLHNGNMTDYVKYSDRVLDQLNAVLTDSMDDDFLLFGFKVLFKPFTPTDDRWELNTDRCAMELAKMMQTVRLMRDMWPSVFNRRIRRGQATMSLDFR